MTGFVVTRANIRIWIHDRDMGRLQQMLWEGHGDKLRVETSNNPRVRRLLVGVPYIMGTIRDVHMGAVTNDLALFQMRSADPVPVQILASKDQNGLTPLHKAAGLGHERIVDDVLERLPTAVSSADHEGRQPLHYAAALRDGGAMYGRLVAAGADEQALDNRGRPAAWYRAHPGELDAKLLSVIPEAPRTASVVPPGWDWRIAGGGAGAAAGVAAAVAASEAPTAPASQVTTPVSPKSKDGDTEPSEEVASEEQVKAPEIKKAAEGQTPEDEVDEGVGEEGDNGDDESGSGGRDSAQAEQEEEQQKGEMEKEAAEESSGIGEGELTTEPESTPNETVGMDNGEEGEKGEENEGPTISNEEKGGDGVDEETGEGTDRDASNEENRDETETEEDGQKREEVEREEAEREAAEREEAEREEKERQEAERQMQLERERELERALEERSRRQRSQEVRSEEEDEGEQADDEDAAGEDEQQGAEQEKPEDAEQAGDEEVSRLVAAGDVDQLAAMVLSGDGGRLARLRAHHPDVQAFLDNVPAYMEKIAAVHAAARAGSVRELQAALDRRRFAVARDAGCTARPTPLHAAVLLGHTDVVRYLGARFPETLAATDARGRTPLHYAACLADNGHYYHLLTALGARADALDQDGHTPEYYLQHPDELSHRQLLQDIGADEKVADNLVDKERRIASSQGEPVFWTEEGRYLAASLGDPLIKGLKEIADKRPQDPVTYLATYLFNAANNHKSISNMQENDRLIAPPPPAKGRLEAAPIPSDMDPQEPDIEEVPETPEKSAIDRDEHGQSMLHFAAARAHGRNGLFQLLQETGLNAGYRDELYRTARDVAIQANIPDNIHDIDKWVLHLAANGEREKLMELLLEGYDHILDVENDDGLSIIEVVAQSEQPETLQFLQSISDFEERREELHNAVRQGNLLRVRELLEADDAELLAIAKNIYGRSSLHIAVLCQDEEITQFLTDRFPTTLKTGDNLERTALHYAMGVEKVEELSTFLIRAGARRIAKDLKGRQPSYYFMNKSDILRLQEDEDTFKM
ncbi:uncharacterized protein LOC126355260 isoform X1 [Schistocerca gregaria]|uniref:uncharacterized protein LOC126355260 isoform X1 n=1 Tax=Schistocerca gregaria TaxID=7010 RepID=UPI00211E40C0|nr:uncharacterized protein LOC126355260 isoform X1 [Schistocerca gregaria]